MPNDKDSGRDNPQNGDSRVLRNFALLTLPWLSFQRDLLALMKRGIEDASNVRPIENLTSRQLQALTMILDPSGKWRGLLDRDLQDKIMETYAKIFPKLVSGSILLIETQEAMLASISEQFDNLRKDKAGGNTSGNVPGRTKP
jgi:hypothetical protein